MNQSPDNLEIEVKFHLKQPEALLRRLMDLGATAQPERFERNLRFEDTDCSLKASQKLLRLRRDDTCRLTFKSRPLPMETECKVYRELEVTVSDFHTMQGILNGLGFKAVQTYEKRRRILAWNQVELCIDTLPYGTFLEIEGAEADIRTAAAQLGLPWKKRILSNYLSIFEVLRSRYKLPFHDVTFANFEPYPVDITSLLGTLENG